MNATVEQVEWLSKPKPSAMGFWFLVGLSLIGFVPSILMPVWEDYQGMMVLAEREGAIQESLKIEIESLNRRVTAILTDPTVTLRMARRELGFRKSGETTVSVASSGGGYLGPAEHVFTPTEDLAAPAALPPALRGFLSHLPDLNYRAIFVEEPTRSLITVLSAAVLLAAFVIYHPPARPRRRLPD